MTTRDTGEKLLIGTASLQFELQDIEELRDGDSLLDLAKDIRYSQIYFFLYSYFLVSMLLNYPCSSALSSLYRLCSHICVHLVKSILFMAFLGEEGIGRFLMNLFITLSLRLPIELEILDRLFYLSNMATSPSHRRKGSARLLLQCINSLCERIIVEDRNSSYGANPNSDTAAYIALHVDKRDIPAVRLYEKRYNR